MTHVWIHDKLYEKLEERSVEDLLNILREAQDLLRNYQNVTKGARKWPSARVHVNAMEEKLRDKITTIRDVLTDKEEVLS
jgi:hypothetical protein